MSYNQDSPNSPTNPTQQGSNSKISRLDIIVAVFTIIGVIAQGASLAFQIKEYYEPCKPEAAEVVQIKNQSSQCQSEPNRSR
ncbi:MAG: hypothetical protein AB1589_27155 [Cyanobacteriota bacterium]